MNITLKQLRAFVSVADAGSFTEAAQRLHLTQSGLSLLVKELETELGVRLFDRSTRRIRLSVAGSDFYPQALRVLEDLDSAVNSTLQLQEKQRGSIRVACTPLYSTGLLPQALTGYQARYPAIRVRLLDSLNEQALSRVANGEADIGIAPTRPTSQDIIQEPLFRDRFTLICPTDHPLARRKRVSWAQALAYPFVSLTRDYTARLQADLIARSPSLTLRPTQEVSFLTTALGMVKWGHGITALPSCALPMVEWFGLAAIAVDEPAVDRMVCLFQRRGQSLSPAATSFREFMLDFTAELRASPRER